LETATEMGNFCKFETAVGTDNLAIDMALVRGTLVTVVVDIMGILCEVVRTAPTTGMATDLGMGSVGRDTAIVVRGIPGAAGAILAADWFCSRRTGCVFLTLSWGSG